MSNLVEVKIPDIGDFKEVAVIDVLVKPGDRLKAEDSLITLESDKATMDVPSPSAGTVKDVKVKVGDMVSQGTVVLLLEAVITAAIPDSLMSGRASEASRASVSPRATPAATSVVMAAPEPATRAAGVSLSGPPPKPGQGEEVNAPPPVVLMPGPAEIVAAVVGGPRSHASPSVRGYARELGVDVAKVKGSGPKNRILKEDVQAYVKAVLAGARPAGAGGLDLLPWPKVDFAKYGSIETKPLSRIKKISGANLARNWVMIPHVTQFDDADITALEAHRVKLNQQNEKLGIKVTILAFLVKAAVETLKKYPEANSSIDGDNLVVKHYYHIGFAADTPNGLVVPVIRDADRKSVLDIAREAAELAKKAREGRLSPAEMQGGCFTISSLGGIGGTKFTPIINAPEVAILGVSKSEMRPKWNGKAFVPRLMLPLSLSYDHRVVDGAAGARFVTYLSQLLNEMAPVPKAATPVRKKPQSRRPWPAALASIPSAKKPARTPVMRKPARKAKKR
ncbi:MAG: dihydrolipoyllysine-residue acetyltransferase [Gammaproteobacteria bacterium]|nr:dihydrolipoyllysine-residue acetyltransferase [Gammaproteobacteria bacterium]